MKVLVSAQKMKRELHARLKYSIKRMRGAPSDANKSFWGMQALGLKEALQHLHKFKGNMKKFKSWVYLNNRVI